MAWLDATDAVRCKVVRVSRPEASEIDSGDEPDRAIGRELLGELARGRTAARIPSRAQWRTGRAKARLPRLE